MFMRNPACLILLSLALAACAKERDPRGVEREEVLLQVMASGRTDTRPDTARFTAGVETIAASAAAASSGNNEKMNRVVAGLERLGIKGDDLQTRQISMQRIDYGPNRGQFQASNMVEVRVRQIARAGDAIAAATEAGANVLSGPNMTVSDPEAASRSAYAQAYKAARARAEAYAEAAGLQVSRVLAIRDGGETGIIPHYAMDGNMSAQVAAPPPISAPPMRPGMNSSEVRVRADFALSAK
jgi:uncharacterized protein YggE